MIIENIYDGKKSNNKINKRKYRKHSMSPFCGLAPNVEKNIEMFNKANDTGSVPTSSAGMNGNSGGEGMGESYIIEDMYEDNKGKWISEDTYVPELAEDGRPYLPKEFWEDWD